MLMKKLVLLEEIQRLNKMVKEVEFNSLTSQKVLAQSQLVDRLLVEYLNHIKYSNKE